MAIADSLFARVKQSLGVRRIILHVCRNPSTGVWALMNDLSTVQNRQPGQIAALGILADRTWHGTYRTQLANSNLPCLFETVPTLFGTAAYLLFIVSNPIRRWVKRLHSECSSVELILHSHSAWMTGAFLPLPHEKAIGIVATFHGIADDHRLRNLLWLRTAHRFMAHRLVHSRAALTAVAKQTAAISEEIFGIPQDRFHIIPNGLEDPKTHNSPRIGSPDEFVVGHIGQMHSGKGWHLLLQAVDGLRTEGLKIRLVLAGHGQDEESARAEAKARSGYVQFLGFVPEAGKALIPRLDALVLATWSEGMPMGAIEAFAAGVPVLATRVGGLTDMIEDGENGIFIERNPASIGDALRKIMLNRDMHRKVGDNARMTFTQKYSINSVAKKYDLVYHEALAGTSRVTL